MASKSTTVNKSKIPRRCQSPGEAERRPAEEGVVAKLNDYLEFSPGRWWTLDHDGIQ